MNDDLIPTGTQSLDPTLDRQLIADILGSPQGLFARPRFSGQIMNILPRRFD